MDIETYAKIVPQYYHDDLSPLLRKYLESEDYTNILDCGCGDGTILYALNKFHYLDGKRVFAVDLSNRRIELVKKINANIIATIDSAEELRTIDDDSIDFFLSTQVIEHVDDKKMIDQIEKKVRKGGCIYISTVFKKWYGWYFYRNNNTWVIDPTHIREYTRNAQLLDLFDRNKFRISEEKKQLQWFPISDFFIKRFGVKNKMFYENRIISMIRKIKIPIPGYYNWEIVLERI